MLYSALSWEFAEEIGAGVSQAGSRWFAVKLELIEDVKAIDVEFDLIEGVKAVWGCFDVEIESVFWAVGWEFADKAVGDRVGGLDRDFDVKSCFDVILMVLTEANAEIAVEVGRGLYSSAQYVPIRCILQNVSPL